MNSKIEYTSESLTSKIEELKASSDIMNYLYIGESILGKKIPVITLGDASAKKSVLYVATHHALENICTTVLMDFIEEYLKAYESYKQICGINLRYMYKMRKIHIIPMLNPDGVGYRLNGMDSENPIRERVISYNGGSEDFSKWSSNARGVDLNHNYNAYFDEYKVYERESQITAGRGKYSGEYPESEPEIQAIANFIRYYENEIQAVLTLHTQGEEIYYKSKGYAPKGADIKARHISKMTGYQIGEAEGASALGGLTDWYIKEYNKPSYTVECGLGENPLDIKEAGGIYVRLREMLFSFPILF